MDMLKKWKAEREQKKKEELQAKKGSVFRVSKNIDHKDTALFKKSQPVSICSHFYSIFSCPELNALEELTGSGTKFTKHLKP